MRMFNLLNDTEKRKTLRRVNRFFANAFYYKTQFANNIFKNQFPYDYKNTPIGELKGESLLLHNYLFEQSQSWIHKIFRKLTEKQSYRQLAKRKKSNNHSTMRKFFRLEHKLKEEGKNK